MIKDSKFLKEIQEDWKGVRSLQKVIGIGEFDAVSKGSIASITSFRVAHNLTLVFAFSVLKDILIQLRDEEYFRSERSNLGPLMNKSKKYIPWIDFDTIDKGREIRNKIAHDNEIIDAKICFKYINAIECELKAWEII
jgi:hypothetical protein